MQQRTGFRLPGSSVALALGLATASSHAAAQAPAGLIEYPNPTTVRSVLPSARRLDLGEGDVQFHRIAAVLPLRGGAFLVVNGGTAELRFFDVSGHLTASVGRPGQGPGEYGAIREVVLLAGDSIAVLDPSPRTRRVSILNPSGAFVRSFPLQAPFDSGGFATHMVALGNGTLLIGYSELMRMAPQSDPVYFGQRFFRYSTDGQLRSRSGLTLPDREHFVQATTPRMGGVAYWDRAFGRIMSVRADSTFFLAGDGTDWTIEQRSADGVVLRTHRVKRPLLPVSAGDIDAYRERALAGSKGEERVIAERMVAEMPFPKHKPAYRRFETDAAGRLWLEVYADGTPKESVWIRLDPKTRTAVAVAFPSRFRAFAFTDRLVYGVWRDSDDVEHVQVFALDGL